jgi:hypothetical protein
MAVEASALFTMSPSGNIALEKLLFAAMRRSGQSTNLMPIASPRRQITSQILGIASVWNER